MSSDAEKIKETKKEETNGGGQPVKVSKNFVAVNGVVIRVDSEGNTEDQEQNKNSLAKTPETKIAANEQTQLAGNEKSTTEAKEPIARSTTGAVIEDREAKELGTKEATTEKMKLGEENTKKEITAPTVVREHEALGAAVEEQNAKEQSVVMAEKEKGFSEESTSNKVTDKAELKAESQNKINNGDENNEKLNSKEGTGKETAQETKDVDSDEDDKKEAHVDSHGRIEFKVNSVLRKIIVCPLCEGMYREPITTIKCRHTFCKSCFITAFEMGLQYECPSCSLYLGQDLSKIARQDRTLENIIDKVLFPEAAARDTKAEREFYRQRGIAPKREYVGMVMMQEANEDGGAYIDESDGDDNMSTSSSSEYDDDSSYNEEGESNKPRRKKMKSSNPPSSTPVSPPLNRSEDEMVFRLRPHTEGGPTDDSLPPLEDEYLKTSGRIRMGQLKKYLRIKLPCPNQTGAKHQHHHRPNNLEIYCNSIPLGNELSVSFVLRTVWMDASKELTLTYGFKNQR